ncbi:MAG: hypothetical protein D6775_04850 [Caldilineae bacterium]|nr:MAG: hypothetical protein D6775_04850 [Caldilineae bacterium]
MTNLVHREPSPWQERNPWLTLLSFLITVGLATFEHWSAEDLAWSFWLAGLVLGLVYLGVYQVAQGDRETLLAYPFFWLFFYFLFAGFLDLTFSWTAWMVEGGDMPGLFAGAPVAIARAVRERWWFLITSGFTLLPTYVLDARTVNFTDWGKPMIGKDLLRMVALVFLLVPMAMFEVGIFALYAVLLVYFFPWSVLRYATGRLWRFIRRQ